VKKLILTVLVLLSATAHAAFDGSGNFNRLYNWQADKAANIKIQASRMDAEMDGMATGLSTCITKDGQTTVTSNISLNSHKLTALSNATASTDAVNASQVRDNTLCSGTGGGSLNAYTFTRNITGSSYVTGTVVWMPAPFTNTAAATLNLDGLGAKTIKKNGTTDLTSGDIVSGTTYPFFYDGTYWQAPTIAQSTATPDSIVSSTNSIKAISATSTVSITAGNQNVAWATSQTFNVSGTLNVGGVPVTGVLTLITATTVSGVNYISLTGLTGYNVYKIYTTYAGTTGTGTGVIFGFSSDNAASVVTSNYNYTISSLRGGSVYGGSENSANACLLAYNITSDGSNVDGESEVTLYNLNSSTKNKTMEVHGGSYQQAVGDVANIGHCRLINNTAMNAARISVNGGLTTSMTVRVYGIR